MDWQGCGMIVALCLNLHPRNQHHHSKQICIFDKKLIHIIPRHRHNVSNYCIELGYRADEYYALPTHKLQTHSKKGQHDGEYTTEQMFATHLKITRGNPSKGAIGSSTTYTQMVGGWTTHTVHAIV